MESDSRLNLSVEVTINKRELTTYKETHVPTARPSHVRLAMAIAAGRRLEV